MFHLEKAIQAWRRSLIYRRAILPADLDELERHLRDEVQALQASGHSEERAFSIARDQMGDAVGIDLEYQKIYWGKLRRQHSLTSELKWRLSMLKNYLTVATRVLIKQRLYAVINILGLAVGIACCMLLLLYVQDELTFDRFHENGDRIARVVTRQHNEDGSIRGASAAQPLPLAEALEDYHPAIEATVRFLNREAHVRTSGMSQRESLLFADPGVLTAFTFPLLEGPVESALDSPGKIVLSEAAAHRYFPGSSALGQTIEIKFGDAFESLVVSGIARDVPNNSSIRFDFLLSFESLYSRYPWIRNSQGRWGVSSFRVYAVFRPDTDLAEAAALLPAFRAQHYPDDIKNLASSGGWNSTSPPYSYAFQPLAAVHHDPSVSSGLTPPSNPASSWILAGIALAILLLACVNYTALSLGRSAARTREIGLRKVVGAHRMQLMGQFTAETVLVTALAICLAVGLTLLFLPTFNHLAQKDLAMGLAGNGAVLWGLGGLGLIATLGAGFYPALVLSRFKPTELFRRSTKIGGGRRLTHALVLLQFTISVGLIAGAAIMARQLSLLESAPLGYDKENVIVVPTRGFDGEALLARVHSALDGHPSLLGITGMTSAFTRGFSKYGGYGEQQKTAYVYRVESDFVNVMGIRLLEGRDFAAGRPADSTASVLVNETLVKDYGWESGIGKRLVGLPGDPEIVGVMADINFLSLHTAVEPLVFNLDPNASISHILVRARPGATAGAIEALEATWKAQGTDIPLEYTFLDEDLAAQYAGEKRWSQIIRFATGFGVLIACLGLFGLASLSVAGKRKEIGIRRVLGASAASLTAHLSKEYLVIVLVAVGLAMPITWVLANRWLQGFAYRIEPGVLLFALSGLLAALVALTTVSAQTWRAARANPVTSLRSE